MNSKTPTSRPGCRERQHSPAGLTVPDPSTLFCEAVDLAYFRVDKSHRQAELLDLGLHLLRASGPFGRLDPVVMRQNGFQIRVVTKKETNHISCISRITVAGEDDDGHVGFIEAPIKGHVGMDGRATGGFPFLSTNRNICHKLAKPNLWSLREYLLKTAS